MKKEIEIKTLGDYLRFKMHMEYYSVRDAAQDIGCSSATISRINNGKSFSIKWIIPIAQWCGLNTNQLWELLDNER